MHRFAHGILRFLVCGSVQTDDEGTDAEVEIELDVGSDSYSVPLTTMESLESGFDTVMQRALTFAQKWSKSDNINELLMAENDSAEAQGMTFPYSPTIPLVLDADVQRTLGRMSSQDRFEQLMHRTSQFYRPFSFLQQDPALIVN